MIDFVENHLTQISQILRESWSSMFVAVVIPVVGALIAETFARGVRGAELSNSLKVKRENGREETILVPQTSVAERNAFIRRYLSVEKQIIDDVRTKVLSELPKSIFDDSTSASRPESFDLEFILDGKRFAVEVLNSHSLINLRFRRAMTSDLTKLFVIVVGDVSQTDISLTDRSYPRTHIRKNQDDRSGSEQLGQLVVLDTRRNSNVASDVVGSIKKTFAELSDAGRVRLLN